MPDFDTLFRLADKLYAYADSVERGCYADVEWNEGDHPRDTDGKFGSGDGVHAAAERFRDRLKEAGLKPSPVQHSTNRHGEKSSYIEAGGIRWRVSDHEANANFRSANEITIHHESADGTDIKAILAQAEEGSRKFREKQEEAARARILVEEREREQKASQTRQASQNKQAREQFFASEGIDFPALRGKERDEARVKWGKHQFALAGSDKEREAIVAVAYPAKQRHEIKGIVKEWANG